MEGLSSNKKDEEVAQLVQSGDVEVFGVLVDRYEKKIKHYGKKFLNRETDIEDVVQEVFLKAYRNIQGFDTKRKFSSWLYRIAHNEFVNRLKKSKREPLHFFDFDILFPHLLGHKEGYKEKIDKKVMKECLDKLPLKYREPIILYYFHNLSYKEIADVLAVPVSTVGIRMKRGKEKLKPFCEKLKPYL